MMSIQRLLKSQLGWSLRSANFSSTPVFRSSLSSSSLSSPSSTKLCRTFTNSRFLRQTVSPGPPPTKKVSPHISFYQSYGTAMAKVMLMSIVIYQALYLVWVKAENAEIKHKSSIDIENLETKVKDMVVVKKEEG